MKKGLSISLFITFFVFGTEFHQFLKIPFLIQHYLEHKELNNEMSLFKFLSIHYTDKIIQDKDFEKDMKLPFKTCQHLTGFSTLYIFQNLPDFLVSVYYKSTTRMFVFQDQFLSSIILSSIWQPPKFS